MTRKILICITIFICFSAFVSNNKPKLPKEYTFIPGGTIWDGDEETGKRLSSPDFYMSKYEITNIQYREFLNEITPHLENEQLKEIKIDSAAWNAVPLYGAPMRSGYFTLPAYNDYPVVNITYGGALKYCDWLQQKIQKDNPGFLIKVKLPSPAQWTYAALGGRSFALYPWSGNYLRDKHGKFLCNFNFIDASAIARNKETGVPEIIPSANNEKHAFTTLGTASYFPNDFNLYNMSGNAAEMTDLPGICMGGSWQDFGGDVTVRSGAKYDKPSPAVGFRPIIFAIEINTN